MAQALIIIDLIEDIVGVNALSSESHQQVLSRQVIAKTNQAAKYARHNGIPVIWVKVGFDDDYHDIPAGSPMFQHIKNVGALKLNGKGCDWVRDLDVHFRDQIVIKKGVSAFTGNKLSQWLVDNNIDQLYFGGVSSVKAIQSSARQAHDLGFSVTVLEDLCSDPIPEQHEQSMRALEGMATISSLEAFVLIK